MKKDILITLADKGYLEQAKQLFYSAVANGGWQGDLMLLAYELADADLRWFTEKGIIIFHCPKWDVQGGSDGSYSWPPVVWHKMHILKPYFRQWRTIVFLDGDIIVRSSIRALAEVSGFSAVRCRTRIRDECIHPIHAYLKGLNWRLLGEVHRTYDLDRKGFNSGLIAFPSSVIWDDLFDKVVEIQKKYSSVFMIPEQVTFNLIFREWNALPDAYSMYPIDIALYTHMRPEEIEGIAIHFILEKPWIKTHPFYGEWKVSYDKACAAVALVPEQPIVSMADSKMAAIDKRMSDALRKGRCKQMRGRVVGSFWWLIGTCGMCIRKISPRAYYFLKGNSHA